MTDEKLSGEVWRGIDTDSGTNDPIVVTIENGITRGYINTDGGWRRSDMLGESIVGAYAEHLRAEIEQLRLELAEERAKPKGPERGPGWSDHGG